MSPVTIFMNSPTFAAGERIKGRISIDKEALLDTKHVELKVSCFFCEGVLVNPALGPVKIVLPLSPVSAPIILPFEYQLPSCIPASNPKFVNGVDMGVKYSLSVRLVSRKLFRKDVCVEAPVTVTRKDSGAGLKVKFVKIGGQSFKKMVAGLDSHETQRKPVSCQ
jgi:hypothetical protein